MRIIRQRNQRVWDVHDQLPLRDVVCGEVAAAAVGVGRGGDVQERGVGDGGGHCGGGLSVDLGERVKWGGLIWWGRCAKIWWELTKGSG